MSAVSRLRAVVAPLLRNRFLQRARYVLPSTGYALWCRLRPVVPGRVVLASDSRSSLSGNLGYLAADLAERYPDHEVVPLLKPRLRARRSLKDTLRLPYLLATSEVVVLDDYYPLVYAMNLRPQTTLAQVWHAAGAFKTVGFSREGQPGGPIPGSNVHRGYTYVSVSSEVVRPSYAEAFRMPLDQVHAHGVPRTDLFFDDDVVAATRERVRGELGIPEGSRVVLYAPTFRGRGQKSAYFDLEAHDWEPLRRTARGGAGPAGEQGQTVVLLKQHPFVPALAPGRAAALGFQDVSSYREVNDLLLVADVLVTDYSSVIFEYALLGRPIVFFTPDLEEYVAERDFYHPFETYLVGPVARTGAQLAEAVRDALTGGVADPQRYREFVERFCGACDGGSTHRVTDALLAPGRAAGPGEGA